MKTGDNTMRIVLLMDYVEKAPRTIEEIQQYLAEYNISADRRTLYDIFEAIMTVRPEVEKRRLAIKGKKGMRNYYGIFKEEQNG